GQLYGVSCASASLCVAVGESGDVVTGVGGVAPQNTSPPVITGTPKAGQRLSCSRGTWSNNPTSFAFNWIRNGTILAGEMSNTYSLATLDEGTTLICRVTASN